MYLNLIQLAESLGVEEDVVESWVRKDKLPCVHDAGRLLFDRAQVAAWAAGRGMAAKAGFLAPTARAAGVGVRLETLLRVGGIWRDVDPKEVLAVIGRVVARLPDATPQVRKMLAQRVALAGSITWAPVGGGIALPHLRSHVALGRDAGLLAILFLSKSLSVPERPPDDTPVTHLLFFIAPSPRAHLELLARLSGALTGSCLRERILESAPDDVLVAAARSFDAGCGEVPLNPPAQP